MIVAQHTLFTEYIMKLVDIYDRLIIDMIKILMFCFTFKGIGEKYRFKSESALYTTKSGIKYMFMYCQ